MHGNERWYWCVCGYKDQLATSDQQHASQVWERRFIVKFIIVSSAVMFILLILWIIT